MTKDYCRDCVCLVCHCEEEWFCDELDCNIGEVDKCPEEVNGDTDIEE